MLTAHKVKLENILNKSVKYSVPSYQRNFEWKKNNAEEFWEDIKSQGTFLGTIVFNVSKEDTEKEIEVVDGQQRLTTVFILLSALRTRAKIIGTEASTRQALKIQEYLSFVDNTSGEASGTKLLTSDSIRDAFELSIVNQNWDGKFTSKEFKNKKRQSNRLKPIFDFFYEKVLTYSSDDIKEVLANLYSSEFVEIKIEKTEEAFEIFERTNARGMDLNAADLLKNYLFAQSGVEETEERWNTVTEYASGNILRMIKYFYVSKRGAVKKKELFQKLKEYGNLIGSNLFLEELERFSRLHDLIINKDTNDFIEYGSEYDIEFLQTEYHAHELNRRLDAINLFGITQSYPLILKTLDTLTTLKTKKEKDSYAKLVLQLVKLIENFHFINSAIAQRPGNEVEKFYADMCEGEIDLEKMKNLVGIVKSKFSELRVGQNEFVERFKELTYQSDYKLVFYINDRLNNENRTGGQIIDMYDSDSKALRRSFDMEHLVAQDASNYPFANDESFEEIVHNIGNLIVISKHTNGGLQNKHITQKLPIIQDKEVRLPEVDKLVTSWKDTRWDTYAETEKNILERAEDLGTRAYKNIWVL